MTPLSMIDFHAVSLLVSERVVACLIAGTLLTAVAGLALRLINHQSARTKFALCFTTLMGVAFFPVYGWWQAQGAASSIVNSGAVLHLPEAWAGYICLIWAVGTSIALARVAVGLYSVARVRKSCVPVEPTAIDASLQDALAEFQLVRKVQLCTSPLVRVPTAIGFWRPVIALPTWCIGDLSPAELHSVVLHELEHLRRYDDWTNLFQRVVGAVFFFHPAVWWLESRLSLEREMACDDAVLSVVPDPKTYARCLVALAEKSYLRRGIALAQAAVSRAQQLTARVTQILGVRRRAATSIWKPVLSVVVVTVFAGSVSLELAPRLVAFQSDAAANISAASTVLSGSTAGQRVSEKNAGDNDGSALTNPASRVEAQASPQTPEAFELRPTPARWVEPAPQQRFAAKPATLRSPTSSVIAASSSTGVAAMPEDDNASESASNAVADNDFARRSIVSDPELAALNASFALHALQAENVAAVASPSHMLVMVVHTEERDGSGVVFWSVRVVQWTVFHPQVPHRVTGSQVPTKT